MRALAILAVLLVGCYTPVQPADNQFTCDASNTLYFQDNYTLGLEVPGAGSVPGNGFTGAFTTNVMDEWQSQLRDLPASYLLTGNITIDYWVKNNDAVAPIAIGGNPGEGYHFFNQFGSHAGFIEDYAIEYETVASNELVHYTQVLQAPDGGMLVEPGDRLRLLLTSLVLDDGHDILYGGETPSRIEFTASCETPREWIELDQMVANVDIATNRGLLTGAIPAQEDVNFVRIPFTLLSDTNKLQIRIQELHSLNEIKNDIDLSVQDDSGEVWSIGSPYTDEIGTKWAANLANMPPGNYVVQVNSYSGNDYHGKLFVDQWA